MDDRKLYIVTVTQELVVSAVNANQAETVARRVGGVDGSVYDWAYEVRDFEVRDFDGLPRGWTAACIPYGEPHGAELRGLPQYQEWRERNNA